ncbi:hypothetical protein [Oceanisphaera arctica]|uniref:Uncharacterized protein n=1 Tax=Oceanisphaera arctica TaxID=641510 RepID=A0A2P5TRY5_9GAMM|nr:hypothetical protein [Oceanisphaera arctica]PPL18553.1 hypothetical protein UN63_01020 [Oceanisphaera arctica]GHA17321.1 hypothetical protein GCM10007082_17550 [Oceanisphaera arctica]
MNHHIVALSALLLTGCTSMESLYSYLGQRERVSVLTPGVAVTQTQPSRLESLSFFSTTRFSASQAEPCARELIQTPAQEPDHIRYVGTDVLNAQGTIEAEKRELGILPSHYRIRFQLAELGQLNGTTYGFSQIRVARKDALGLDNHDFTPIAPAGQTTQQVYQELQQLYQQLDACMAG